MIVGRGRHESSLHILEHGDEAFIGELRHRRIRTLFKLWNDHLRDVSYEIVSLLNKLGHISMTSGLSNSCTCNSCQLAKSKRLPFSNNDKRANSVLNLDHCDLWGPSPVPSKFGYLYYVAFIDDYSNFTWLYPMCRKFEFYVIFQRFQAFLKN